MLVVTTCTPFVPSALHSVRHVPGNEVSRLNQQMALSVNIARSKHVTLFPGVTQMRCEIL